MFVLQAPLLERPDFPHLPFGIGGAEAPDSRGDLRPRDIFYSFYGVVEAAVGSSSAAACPLER